MITPQEAERRAHQLVEEYINGALCRDPDEVARVLMKLVGVAGVAMATVTSQSDAVFRIGLCVSYLAKMPASQLPRAEYIKMDTGPAGRGGPR